MLFVLFITLCLLAHYKHRIVYCFHINKLLPQESFRLIFNCLNTTTSEVKINDRNRSKTDIPVHDRPFSLFSTRKGIGLMFIGTWICLWAGVLIATKMRIH